MSESSHCLCGQAISFENCCAPLLKRQKSAQSAEQLMRSRFSAFCVKDMGYIMDTTDPLTRKSFDRAANQAWADQSQFLKLEILASSEKGPVGNVEFKAFYKAAGSSDVIIHHEKARFKKHFGQWYFQDGKTFET